MHMEMHGRVYLNVYGTYICTVHVLRVYRYTIHTESVWRELKFALVFPVV